MRKASRRSTVVGLALFLLAAARANADAIDPLKAGRERMAYGDFVEAAQLFERAEHDFAASGDTESRLQALRALAEARQAMSDFDHAAAALKTAIGVAGPATDNLRVAILNAQLGGVYAQAGRDDLARPLLLAGAKTARTGKNDALLAAVLNDLGSVHQRAGEWEAAREAYDDARRAAQSTKDSAQLLRVLLNAATFELERGEMRRARELATAAQATAGGLDGQEFLHTYGLIRAGSILSEVARLDPASARETALAAHAALRDGRRLAERLHDAGLLSAASGALAGLYLQAHRREEALTLTQEAVLSAQRAGAPNLLVRWHWQAARIYREPLDLDRAIASYRLALAAYETSGLTPSAPTSVLPLHESVDRLYLEFADLLLRKSAGRGGDVQAHLVEARDAVEKSKARELQDYFHDSCVAEARARVKGLAQSLDAGTAVLYPIVLPDRLELLLEIGARVKRYTVAESEADVRAAALRFRESVESQVTRAYLPHAQKLYGWLIAPIAADLADARITTLVTIPDRSLRTIPMAALHDGHQFLIERMAVVMAPGLELIDPRPLPTRSVKTLMAGLSNAVGDFPALLHVDDELDNIGTRFPGRTLRNEAFGRKELEQALTSEQYQIVHIASHGEFSGDVRQSFVMTYDGKVSFDDLARFIGYNRVRSDPLDLLTLSACQTAAGDERAALGVAGLTVKAGARSALASLWSIHDDATAILMTEFYRQLRSPGVSKAQALQRAQLKLAGLTRYRHPGYWSAFVLIGSWR